MACGGPQNAVNVYEIDDGCPTTATLPTSEATSTDSTEGPTDSTSPATTPTSPEVLTKFYTSFSQRDL